MQGLSYGVVRVDDENSLMSLTLQDCGQVLPGGLYRRHSKSSLHQPVSSALTRLLCIIVGIFILTIKLPMIEIETLTGLPLIEPTVGPI